MRQPRGLQPEVLLQVNQISAACHLAERDKTSPRLAEQRWELAGRVEKNGKISECKQPNNKVYKLEVHADCNKRCSSASRILGMQMRPCYCRDIPGVEVA